jgi:uncharacterized membrane protein
MNLCRKGGIRMQNRFKSVLLWSAIIAQAISIGQLTGTFARLGVDAGTFGDVVAGVLQLFVILGILNNPTEANKI